MHAKGLYTSSPKMPPPAYLSHHEMSPCMSTCKEVLHPYEMGPNTYPFHCEMSLHMSGKSG